MATAISEFDAVAIGPGSFYTSLMPIFLVRGVAEALSHMKGPIILIANLLTEVEDRLGIVIEDDELDGEMLETFGSLRAFVAQKVGG